MSSGARRNGPGATARDTSQQGEVRFPRQRDLAPDQRPGFADGLLARASQLGASFGLTREEWVEALRRHLAAEESAAAELAADLAAITKGAPP